MKIKPKKKIIIFLLSVLIFFALFYIKKNNNIKKVVINKYELKLEIADTDKQRKKGLGDREEICENCGMIFLFPQKGTYNFWMKDMKFPLDIIWISDDKVVYFEENVEKDFTGTLYPKVEADKVIEVRSGKIRELNLKIGGKVAF